MDANFAKRSRKASLRDVHEQEAEMKRALRQLVALVRVERGQDLLEYALLTALIALAAVTVVGLASTAINNTFWGGIVTAIDAAL